MKYYIEVLKKYVTFTGRASRKEFWMFVLINLLIMIALAIIESVAGLSGKNGSGPISGLYSLAVFLPSLAVAVRRLHDTGRSGLNLFWFLLPLIGEIILLVYYVLDSQPAANAYGPNPKAATPPPAAPAAPTPVV